MGDIAIGSLLVASQIWAQKAPLPSALSTKRSISTCNLGTDWAVNKNRPVAPDEKLYRLEGGPAMVAQRKSPGSSEVVYKMCDVPPGTEAYCSIRGCWIKICGNDAKDPQGWRFPIEIPAGPPGPMGPPGPQGIQGLRGDSGVDGISVAGSFMALPFVPDGEKNEVRSRGHGKAYATGVAILAAIGGAVVHNNWPAGKQATPKGKPPGVTTDSVLVKCISTSYPNNCPSGARIGFGISW